MMPWSWIKALGAMMGHLADVSLGIKVVKFSSQTAHGFDQAKDVEEI
jgi:hypothetical protein